MGMRLLGPQHVWPRITTQADLLTYVARQAAKRNQQVRPDARALIPFVSEGRWVADCPSCRAGIPIHPEWAMAACGNCFRSFTAVAVPADWEAIEAALEVRDVAHQNTRPGETAADLLAETAAHEMR